MADRFNMLLNETNNLRNVFVLWKSQQDNCPLIAALSEVDQKQLEELHLRTQRHLRAIGQEEKASPQE